MCPKSANFALIAALLRIFFGESEIAHGKYLIVLHQKRIGS